MLDKPKDSKQDEEIIESNKLDLDAFDVIQKLYDGTFRDLVNR